MAVGVAAAFAASAPGAQATFLGANGRIAFSRSPPRAAQNIFSITPSGRGRRQLTSGTFLDFTPSWSPGGTVLAVSRLDSTGGLDVFAGRADGSRLAPITHRPHGHGHS